MRELAKKIISWVFMDKSKKSDSMATIHAPTAKKKSIKPGTANSSKKNTKPAINQSTAAL